jgi:hypothetical protein
MATVTSVSAVDPGVRRSRRNRRIIADDMREEGKVPEIAISDQLSAFSKAVFG